MLSNKLVFFLTLPFAFVVTAFMVPYTRQFASYYDFVSKIDFRRKDLPRPLLGGVAIFGGVFMANFLFNSIPWAFVAPAALLLMIGAIDDKYQIYPKIKLAGELLAVALWLFMIPAHQLLLIKMGVPTVAAYALHAFWVVGVINAFNMIDGMDGLAGGMAALGFFFLGLFLPGELRWFAWSICTACIGFLVYNRPPASIFLGDAGSLLLGFLLSALGSIVHTNHLQITSILIPLFILAHPEIDAILAIARRYRARTPLFQGDKDHIHHKLRRIGLEPKEALGVAYFATVFCGLTALLIERIPDATTDLLATWLCVTGVGSILIGVYYTEHRLASQFSRLGTPLLHRHVEITEMPVEPGHNFTAVVFDLLPYYKELQSRGIGDLNSFLEEFSHWLNDALRGSQLIAAGDYSILAVSESSIEQEKVVNGFKRVVSQHGLLKNDHGLPWGLEFLSSKSDAAVFNRKYRPLFQRNVIEIRKKVA